MKVSDRNVLIAGLVCLAIGWWLASSPASPIRPETEPRRPVLRFVARVAKTFLWVMMVAERPPQEANIVHARIDSEGHQVLNHGQGW
jgi:hypothetical protein